MTELVNPAAIAEAEARTIAAGAPAPHAHRAVAWLIDTGVLLLVLALQPWWSGWLVLSLFVAYHGLSVWLVGQTLGKAAVGLRVDRLDGERTLFWSLGRASLGYLGVDALGVGVLVAFANPHRRCAHDYVFGSRVVVEEERGGLLSRLADFAERQKQAAAERKRVFTVLAAVLAWPLGLAQLLRRALEVVTPGAHAPATAPLKVLSAKVAAGVAAATAATTALAVAYVPPVADAVRFLVQPRSFWPDPAPVEAIAGSWRVTTLTQVENEHWRSTEDLPAERWKIDRADGRYRLVRGSQVMRLAGENDGSYTATWKGPGSCIDRPAAGPYRVDTTLRLRPLEKGARVDVLEVSLQDRASPEDPAKAEKAACPLNGTATYTGTARRAR